MMDNIPNVAWLVIGIPALKFVAGRFARDLALGVKTILTREFNRGALVETPDGAGGWKAMQIMITGCSAA